MFEHLEDLMLTIFVLLVLEYLLYCYLLTGGPVGAEVYHTESALPRHSLYLELAGGDFGLGLLGVGEVGLGALVGFGAHVFLEAQGLVLVDLEVLAGEAGILGHVFRVDIDEFGFGGDLFGLLELVFIGGLERRLLHFGDDPAVHLLAGTALLVLRVLLIENHCLSIDYNYSMLAATIAEKRRQHNTTKAAVKYQASEWGILLIGSGY